MQPKKRRAKTFPAHRLTTNQEDFNGEDNDGEEENGFEDGNEEGTSGSVDERMVASLLQRPKRYK